MHRLGVLLLSFGVASAPVWADEKADIEAVKKVLQKIIPTSEADVVSPSQIPGVFEAVYGTQIFYISKDGKYLIQGDMIDVQNRENMSDKIRGKQRLKLIKTVDEKSMIVFNPKGPVKHTVTVFTDVDCGYCRKLHSEIDQYLDRGIRVRYLAFPRSGPNTKSYYKAVSVWCSSDRKAALTRAKSGEEPEKKTCDNPVDEHFKLGEDFGVTGTPSLVLDDGEVIPGYVPADRLEKIMNGQKG